MNGVSSAAAASKACPLASRQVRPAGVVTVMVHVPVSAEAKTSITALSLPSPMDCGTSP